MKLFEELRQDLAVPPAGARAPYYFRYLGYMQDPAAPITTARGNALFSLFTKTTPHVHPHELITGYDYSLWCEADEATLQYGISVLIDTAGNVPYTAFELTNPYVDGYLFDYKTDEAEKYSRLGGDRHLIRDNIRALLRDEKNVRIRIPLIPNFNTSDAAIHSMCESLRELGVKTVDLIPFHRMGSGKYKALGLSYPYQDISLLAKEQLQKIRNTFSDYFETNLEI